MFAEMLYLFSTKAFILNKLVFLCGIYLPV